MDRKRLTLMLIAGASDEPRTLHIPARMVRYLLGGAAVLGLVVIASTLTFVLDMGEQVSVSRLEKEKALLAENLEQMEGQVEHLQQTLASISERDRRFRLLAGLPDIDDEVRQVGIGGPGTESIESAPLFKLGSDLSDEVFSNATDLNRLLRQANLLEVSMEEAVRAVEARREMLTSLPSIDPTEGWLSSTFSSSRYHPLLHIRRPHEGIDLSAWPGSPVVATADGVVEHAGWRSGFGYTVEIDHGNGYETRYAHNQKNLQVRAGDRVRRGDLIAYVGSSGVSTAPHVHYEVIKDGKPVDPEDYRLQKVIVD